MRKPKDAELSQRMGRHLRRARWNLGLSQEEVAERIGMSPAVYWRLERGAFTPRVSTLVKLCGVLNLEADVVCGLVAYRPRAENAATRPPEEPPEFRAVVRRLRRLDAEALEVFERFAALLQQINTRKARNRVGV